MRHARHLVSSQSFCAISRLEGLTRGQRQHGWSRLSKNSPCDSKWGALGGPTAVGPRGEGPFPRGRHCPPPLFPHSPKRLPSTSISSHCLICWGQPVQPEGMVGRCCRWHFLGNPERKWEFGLKPCCVQGRKTVPAPQGSAFGTDRGPA